MKLLVVDDEPPARNRLVRLLAELGHTDVREAADAESARRSLAGIDVVLLDVSMPGIDGLSFAALERLPAVIFVTGDPAHAARAFDVEAADFVTKPVRKERLARALERARLRAAVPTAADPVVRLRVLDGAAERFVDARQVEVFRAEQKYVVFHEGGRELVVRESLDELEARLGDPFLRVHRACLVQLAAVTELRGTEGAEAVTRSGAVVPVSRRAIGELRRRLKSPLPA
jgi:DNA-binding LytR/AlgR family response regulator